MSLFTPGEVGRVTQPFNRLCHSLVVALAHDEETPASAALDQARAGAVELVLRLDELRTEHGGTPLNPAPSHLAPKDVARMFGVSTSTVARWARQGVLQANRASGGRRRYPADQFDCLRRRDVPGGGTGVAVETWGRAPWER